MKQMNQNLGTYLLVGVLGLGLAGCASPNPVVQQHKTPDAPMAVENVKSRVDKNLVASTPSQSSTSAEGVEMQTPDPLLQQPGQTIVEPPVDEAQPVREREVQQKLKEMNIKEQRPTTIVLPKAKSEQLTGKGDAAAEQEMEGEFVGLIIADTMTRIGVDFHDYFNTHWTPPIGVPERNIIIKEISTGMWGSWIKIFFDMESEEPVWQTILRPRSTDIEEIAEQGVATVQQIMIEMVTATDESPLEAMDMSGEGI